MNYSQPDFLSLDIEGITEFGTWASIGHKSANFRGRLQPGESNSTATLRIGQSFLGGLVEKAKAARPGIKPYLYDAYAAYDHGFQFTTWPMLKNLGFGSCENFEFCIKNEKCCIENEKLCIKHKEFCITKRNFVFKIMNFAGRQATTA